MTEKQAKQPAHEVILRKLKERIEGFDGVMGSYESACALGAIAILADVLREMDIPEKERENVLAQVQRVADQQESGFPISNILRELYEAISHE